MAAREHTDQEIVELIKLLPVTLEIGEFKLYDTGRFGEFYDQYLRINDGVISLFDELHEMFCLNTHSGLENFTW